MCHMRCARSWAFGLIRISLLLLLWLRKRSDRNRNRARWLSLRWLRCLRYLVDPGARSLLPWLCAERACAPRAVETGCWRSPLGLYAVACDSIAAGLLWVCGRLIAARSGLGIRDRSILAGRCDDRLVVDLARFGAHRRFIGVTSVAILFLRDTGIETLSTHWSRSWQSSGVTPYIACNYSQYPVYVDLLPARPSTTGAARSISAQAGFWSTVGALFLCCRPRNFGTQRTITGVVQSHRSRSGWSVWNSVAVGVAFVVWGVAGGVERHWRRLTGRDSWHGGRRGPVGTALTLWPLRLYLLRHVSGFLVVGTGRSATCSASWAFPLYFMLKMSCSS